MQLLGVLLALQVVLSRASLVEVDTAHGTLTLEKRPTRGAERNLEGSFRSLEGHGIHFRSTPHSVEVKTLDGRTLVNAYSYSAAAQDEDEEETAIYQILDDVYADANGQLHRSSTDLVRDSVTRSEFLATLQTTPKLNDPLAAMQTSVVQLVAHPSIQLLEPAALALGNDLGITGEDEPAAMPFYTAALTLTEAYHRNEHGKLSTTEKTNPWDFFNGRVTTQGKYPNCDLDTCPPCKEDECYGLCGYGCNCWKHVCKDCCYHKGCRDHDKCCRNRGFFDPTCLFPVRFKCNKRYKCRYNPFGG
jgi:hypothetical protein